MTSEQPTFSDYQEAIRWFGAQVAQNWKPDSVGDVGAEPSVDERLIQYLWNDGMLVGRPLQTLRGKQVTILNPGDWNHEAGPDFRRAEIALDGRIAKGDIEIHVQASAWSGHRHGEDFEYNTVILHVFLENDDGKRADHLHNGRDLERLCLEPYFEPDFESLRQTLSPDEYPMGDTTRRGRCGEVIDAFDDPSLVRFLDLAGDQRLERKAARFEAQMSGESLDQVFYQALMTTLGHKSGKALYFLLAKRAPVAELLDHAADCEPADRPRLIEAILYHVGSLAPAGDETRPLDEEAQAYLDLINRHWSRVAGYFSDRIIPSTKRWYAGIRPVNFPCRRVAGVAHLLGQWRDRGPVSAVLDLLWQSVPGQINRKTVKRMAGQIENVLSVQIDHFWTRRYSWWGKLAPHPMSLIGKGQASSLLFNAVLPIALLWARREGDAEREATVLSIWRQFPRLPENRVVRLMQARLFGDGDRVKGLLTTEHRTQALFQIFEDCCNNYAVDCSQCSLVASNTG